MPIMKLHFMQSPSVPCHLVPPRPKYLPEHPILEPSKPMFLHQCDRPSSTPIKKGTIIVLQSLILAFLDSRLEDRKFWTEC